MIKYRARNSLRTSPNNSRNAPADLADHALPPAAFASSRAKLVPADAVRSSTTCTSMPDRRTACCACPLVSQLEVSRPSLNTIITVFGSGLLAFAFITAFVSAFLINNVFQITIGQRLRELALLRAVGANGRQVRRMIYAEALVMALIATVLGS